MHVPPFSLNKQLSEIGPQLEEALLRVLRSGHYIGGSEVEHFEKGFAESVGVPFAVSCNSGTDALIIALRALDIGPGDEVITCSFSFFATAEAITLVGAKPVFVEVDPHNYLIDIQKIESAITPSTKALLPVHLFGCPVNMDELMKLAHKNNLKVIEDCAQASGTKWNGDFVGSFGDVGCFSFFPTKNLGASGDGGAVTTKNKMLSIRMRQLAVHGMPKRYVHTEIGYNSRLDAIQASILNVKLPLLEGWIERRKSIASKYRELLKDVKEIQLPMSDLKDHSWNQFVIRIKSLDKDFDSSEQKEYFHQEHTKQQIESISKRDWLQNNLTEKGISTIIYYPIPIHLQPAYKCLGYTVGQLPQTEKLSKEVLSLPIFPEITIDEQQYVVSSIKDIFKNSKYP